jgi:hypothetical protein
MRAPTFLFGALAALALTPSLAAASTYCAGVSGGGCITSYPATGAGLQSALDAADLGVDIDGTPDTVLVGPGTYAAPSGFRTIGGDLSIVGSGESTILSSTGSGGAETDVVLALKPGGTPAASVSSLQVRLIDSVQAGAIFSFRKVSDVHIGGPGTLIDDAIALPNGGRVTRTLIDPAAFKDGIAIDAQGGVIEDTLVRLRVGAPADRAAGVIVSSPAVIGTSTLTIRHLTMVGDGSPQIVGIRVQADKLSTGVVTSVLHLRDSLLHGLGTALVRTGGARNPNPICKSDCFDAVANIDTTYSSLAAASVLETGPGAITAGPGNLADAEPLLGPGGDPLAGSSLINAGDPAGAEAGDSATDLAGGARIQAGRRDIGAVESALSPPAPVVPPPPPVTSPAGAQAALVVSVLSLSHRRFRVGAPPRRGTTVRFTLSAAASYTLGIERVLPGRLAARRGKAPLCRATKRRAKASRGKACSLYRKAGTLTGRAAGGAVSVAFSGRIGRSALKPGSYRLTVGARDGAGRAAQAQRVTFTVRQ